ncbi:tetratricopeptide repeat protein [Nocardia sp. CDC159]|uniref:Tetratricopeptide repeat protein n=1 Tax=Nocardia pulmonis TaxID=2951408 RepID=A0A9X2E450_9NOCA|nr:MULTISPECIES: tetratricopeptide repeat protein [Nocardia]MCM6773894.1 tetratricopeptide repeat protein [Nocardia pulmonis]MCM6786781.1 tetratricopeptide repeat protein [Nocardia sp. CDC159]
MERTPLRGGGGSGSARRVFADRLSELFEAAGKPTLKQVVRATARRMRAAQGPGGHQPVTVQRVSDWRSGRNLPHTFEAAAPVLVTLFAMAKAQPGPLGEDLVDLRAWKRLWTSAVTEPPGGSSPLRPVAIRALPRDVDALVGREEQLRRIVQTAGSERVVSIHTINGMPGIGKTALAIRAAHELAPRFPDGQYFVQLHAHTPGQPVADPAEVLAGLLTDLGIDPRSLPDTLAARRNLWRDRLADKRVLLVLDDAHGLAQIEPLLPSGDGCLTIVTSRRRLVALDGAMPLALEVLDPDAAVSLFAFLARRGITGDTDAAAAERAAADRLVELCGYLPLAIVLLAGRLAHHAAWSITDLAERFTATTDRLAELDTSDRAVRAAFELSYRDLPVEQQTLFRQLGLHPGTEFDPGAVAALAAIPLDAARRHLDALYTDHLLEETRPGRYRLHDLLREYVGTLAATTPAADDIAAVERLLDYYQHTATRANRWLTHYAPPTDHDTAPLAGPDGIAVREFDDQVRALAWMRTERANLLACLEHATGRDPARMIALTGVLAGLLSLEGPWPLAARLHQRAAETAARQGDCLEEANALTNLGLVGQLTDDYGQAVRVLRQALTLHRDLGNRRGEADALTNLGLALWVTDDYGQAASLLRQALTLYRDLGNRHGEANALTNFGFALWLAEDYGQAADLLRQALTCCSDLGNRVVEAYARNALGYVCRETGDYEQAVALHEQALALSRDLGNRDQEASALTALGQLRRETGDHEQAADLHEQALAHFRDVGNRYGEATALSGLGQVRRDTGDHAQAADLLRQALALNRDIGNRRNQADTLGQLAILYERTGDPQRAADLHRQALVRYRDLGSRLGRARELNGVGRVLLATGEPGEALPAFTDALELAREIGHALERARALDGAAHCRAALGDIAAAVADLSAATEIYRRLRVSETGCAAAYLATLDTRATVRSATTPDAG